jgi:hypothetical protein
VVGPGALARRVRGVDGPATVGLMEGCIMPQHIKKRRKEGERKFQQALEPKRPPKKLAKPNTR